MGLLRTGLERRLLARGLETGLLQHTLERLRLEAAARQRTGTGSRGLQVVGTDQHTAADEVGLLGTGLERRLLARRLESCLL